jgi:2-methylcitrate dehydratase PrpD
VVEKARHRVIDVIGCAMGGRERSGLCHAPLFASGLGREEGELSPWATGQAARP